MTTGELWITSPLFPALIWILTAWVFVATAVFARNWLKLQKLEQILKRINVTAAIIPAQSKPLRLGVLISGSGRTLKNLIECSGPDFEVVCVATDRPCLGINHAERAGIATNYNAAIQPAELRDEVLWKFVKREKIDYLCLAGYLSLLSIPEGETIPVLNIHPALIPKFCGEGMYGSKVHKAVLESDDTESGCTVHFCDNKYDHGDIILQKKLTIDPAWDHEQLAAAVFELEKIAYPEAIRSLRKGQQPC